MAARFLLADPPLRTKKWTEADLPPEVVAKYAAVIEKLLELQHNDLDRQPCPVDIGLTERGKAAWVAFYNEHGTAQTDLTNDDLAAAFSKLEGYAARLALIVHLIRWATGDPTVVEAGIANAEQVLAVDEQSIRAGIEMVRWFCFETERIYESLGHTEEQTAHRQLIDWIQQRDGTVTVREVQQHSRRFATADEARAALEALVQVGIGKWLESPRQPKGGRPSERFELVYSANVYETSAHDSVSRGFVDVDRDKREVNSDE